MSIQCKDLQADRSLGEFWERQFCFMAANHHLSFTPIQIGRPESAQAFRRNNRGWHHYTLPDVTIWTCPGQHHEIKHKAPTRHGSFGLEKYRLDALLWFAKETNQDVLYTIHNHALSGGRNAQENSIDHWLTTRIIDLVGKHVDGRTFEFTSYVNGQPRNVPGFYWSAALWQPLAEYWGMK